MLQGVAQAWPFLDDHPPVLVDWLPWSHGLGGNLVLGIALRHAGTLYVDDGDPTPERFERTVRLRAEIPPTLAFDVPLGWTAWVERLRADDALRRRWLSRLDRACWAGAPLAPATRDALRAIGVPLAAAWGSTETSPAVALTTGDDPVYDALGVPLAGVELKLIPSGDAYEARVRGPQVMRGYYWRPDLTAAAFDDEGFYRMGDVVRPVDARAPERGLAYVSRIDERFKLASGAWVLAGELRAAFLAECSDAADVLVSGAGHDAVGLLVWPTAEGRLLDRDVLRAQVADAMRRMAPHGRTGGSAAARADRARAARRGRSRAGRCARAAARERTRRRGDRAVTGALLAGVNIGGTTTSVVLGTPDGNDLERRAWPTQARDGEALYAAVVAALRDDRARTRMRSASRSAGRWTRAPVP